MHEHPRRCTTIVFQRSCRSCDAGTMPPVTLDNLRLDGETVRNLGSRAPRRSYPARRCQPREGQGASGSNPCPPLSYVARDETEEISRPTLFEVASRFPNVTVRPQVPDFEHYGSQRDLEASRLRSESVRLTAFARDNDIRETKTYVRTARLGKSRRRWEAFSSWKASAKFTCKIKFFCWSILRRGDDECSF